MSTGAVFASFTDKSDLFTEIAEAEQTQLYAGARMPPKACRGATRSWPCSTRRPSAS